MRDGRRDRDQMHHAEAECRADGEPFEQAEPRARAPEQRHNRARDDAGGPRRDDNPRGRPTAVVSGSNGSDAARASMASRIAEITVCGFESVSKGIAGMIPARIPS